MGSFWPVILQFIFRARQGERSSRSVHPLRFKYPTQLDLQREKGMEQGRREDGIGCHGVFRQSTRVPTLYFGAEGVPMDELR